MAWLIRLHHRENSVSYQTRWYVSCSTPPSGLSLRGAQDFRKFKCLFKRFSASIEQHLKITREFREIKAAYLSPIFFNSILVVTKNKKKQNSFCGRKMANMVKTRRYSLCLCFLFCPVTVLSLKLPILRKNWPIPIGNRRKR